MPTASLPKQATIFTKYLIGTTPTAQSIELYSQAISGAHQILSKRDEKILAFLLRYPNFVGFVDAGLALTNPHSEVRRRIYLMFAILEVQPQFWRYFLPIKRNFWYIFIVIFAGIRAIFRAIVGVLIVKAVGAGK